MGFFDDLRRNVSGTFDRIGDAVTSTADKTVSGVQSGVAGFVGNVQATVAAGVQNVQSTLGNVRAFVGDAGNQVVRTFDRIGDSVGGILSQVPGAARDFGTGLGQGAGGLLGGVGQGFGDLFQGAGEGLQRGIFGMPLWVIIAAALVVLVLIARSGAVKVKV